MEEKEDKESKDIYTSKDTIVNTTGDIEDIANEQIDDEDNEEVELDPPEEAKELNVGNIFAIIFIAIAVVALVFLVGSNVKKKKIEESKELDKSGTKFSYSFDVPANKQPIEETDFIFDGDDEVEKTEENTNVDDMFNSLPDEYKINSAQQEVGVAPVAPVGQTVSSTSGSSVPDTRNSKSPRKNVEGIKGLEAQVTTSTGGGYGTVSSVLGGTYSSSSNGMYSSVPASKEDYLQQQMEAIQKLQSSSLSAISQSGEYDYRTDRQNFFNAQANTAGNNTLWDGTIISGALITAINTSNPGIVIARVTENVWSSYDHSLLLIPEGSLLYATYNSSISYGQNRVQVAWNLLIRPDGYRMELGNMNGVDAQGASGYKGFVNNHPFEALKALGLVAMFSVIQTEVNLTTKDWQNNQYAQNALTDVYSEASKMGNKILDKALDIQPTITIKEGTEIKLITNTPLMLPPVEIQGTAQKYVRLK